MKTLRTALSPIAFTFLVACLVVIPAGCAGKADFDGQRAMDSLKKQVAFGPRVPATFAHDACRDYLVGALKPNVDSVQVQHFQWTRRIAPSLYRESLKLPAGHAVPKSTVYPMDNIVAVIKGTDGKDPELLLCAHWDCRPTADNEPILANRLKPIDGANDGASGTAVLVELARVFHEKRPTKGVIVVLFDGEDLGPDVGNMLLGSAYYAKHPLPNKPKEAILLDMIGDSDLAIYKEGISADAARELNDTVFATAIRLGYTKQFKNEIKLTIEDDHVPLIRNGIKAIDLIDFDYPDAYNMNTTYWHTLKDTPDKCSAASLEAVGRTVAAVVYERK
jgi:glutaminyl-peptide cyclotransferase